MNAVVDANVVIGYFAEGLSSEYALTASPGRLFAHVGAGLTLFFDEGGQLRHEYRNAVNEEWLEGWYARMLSSGNAYEIPAQNHAPLCKALYAMGFPRTRDIWYVRVAKSLLDRYQNATLITEDIDFYEPSRKHCSAKERQEIIRGLKGVVARHLTKSVGMGLAGVERALSTLET